MKHADNHALTENYQLNRDFLNGLAMMMALNPGLPVEWIKDVSEYCGSDDRYRFCDTFPPHASIETIARDSGNVVLIEGETDPDAADDADDLEWYRAIVVRVV